MPTDRRKFLVQGGLGLLAFRVAGADVLITPQAARAAGIPYRVLTPDEVSLLDAFGDALLPGAQVAGLAHYIDQQLAAPPPDSLLMIRYLDVPPPYADFYRPALAAVSAAARAAFGRRFEDLAADQREQFIASLQKSDPADWHGPPAPFVYFVLRSDAVDVVYGTPEGFEKLGIPYMPHIPPATPW